MQAHLARGEHEVDRLVLVHGHRDLLAAAQQFGLGEGVCVRHQGTCVPAITRMQPLSGVDGVSASQAVTTSALERPK